MFPLPGAMPMPPGMAAPGTPGMPMTSKPAFFKYLPDFLTDNPYFSAGFGLVGVGALIGVLRNGAQQLAILSRRQLLTSLEIPSRDYSYQWVMQWLISKSKSSRHLGVETTYSKDPSGHAVTSFDYIPSPGTHYMRYHGVPLKIDRERTATTVDMTTGTPFETLTLTTFAWKRDIFDTLLREARDKAIKKEEGKTIIFNAFGNEWRPFGNPKRIRPLASVILDDKVAETLLSDVQEFQNRMKWYMERGIPYRRGYLLWGPPGCGKSSFVTALAGELKYNICVLNVADPLLTDDRLQYLLATVPPRCIILLEDIDGAISPSEANAPDGAKVEGQTTAWGTRRVTFSGLLNALDGVVATEERLVFMTTNKYDQLPQALIRPGRVDLKVYVGRATLSQKRRMYLRFFPCEAAMADEFTSILKSSSMSMAELQSYFMFFKDDPIKALKFAHKLVPDPKEDSKSGSPEPSKGPREDDGSSIESGGGGGRRSIPIPVSNNSDTGSTASS